MASSPKAALIALALALPAANAASAAEQLHYERPDGSTAAYSSAVRAGAMVYVSGQLGLGADGKLAEGFEAQARQAMDNVAKVLATMGLGMEQVVQCTAMITDRGQWSAFNTIYAGYFRPERLPARNALIAAGLPMDALVEVGCNAYGP